MWFELICDHEHLHIELYSGKLAWYEPHPLSGEGWIKFQTFILFGWWFEAVFVFFSERFAVSKSTPTPKKSCILVWKTDEYPPWKLANATWQKLMLETTIRKSFLGKTSVANFRRYYGHVNFFGFHTWKKDPTDQVLKLTDQEILNLYHFAQNEVDGKNWRIWMPWFVGERLLGGHISGVCSWFG